MKISNMIHAVDLHACGEPGRVIVGGVLDVPGESMFEKMQYLSQNADSLRLRMLREPRGYPASNCNLILPSNNPEAVAGFVIMEQTEYPGMSGTNTICVVTTLIETGMVDVTEPLTEFKLETPAGLISICAEVRDGKAVNVTFENVPAFSVYTNKSISVPDLGAITQGGLGVAPGANINPEGVSMFEPIGGTAPDFTGKNQINPMAAIGAAQLLLSHLGYLDAASCLENAIKVVIKKMDSQLAAKMGFSTTEIGDLVVQEIMK